MSGSSGPMVIDHRPSLLVKVEAPPGHSPDTFTSFALADRNRNVTKWFRCTSGETSGADSRRGTVFVGAGVATYCAGTAVENRADTRIEIAAFMDCALNRFSRAIQQENDRFPISGCDYKWVR